METAVDLTTLSDRVAPLALARERTLPLSGELAGLFVEGGLVRGRTLVCRGPAATSTALALVAPAVSAGAWLALIDLPTIGLDAAREFGVPLERVVAIRADRQWAEVVAAAADGFDVLLVRVPAELSGAMVRKLEARLRRRDVVTVILGDPGPMACDGVLETGAPSWSGIGDGYGHLRERDVVVRASGRRLPGGRRCRLALPA